eukprot:1489842-Pyramimonas_sp.AAC.1
MGTFPVSHRDRRRSVEIADDIHQPPLLSPRRGARGSSLTNMVSASQRASACFRLAFCTLASACIDRPRTC